MKNYSFVFVCFIISICLFSCEKEKKTLPKDYGYSKGIYIVNEGSYNSNNGSVSFMNPDSNTIINGIFEAANGRPVGDILQSFAVINDSLGFAVVNNSAKVEIVRLSTFEVIADPVYINYPRYSLGVTPEKAYVSAGSFQGYLYIIDLNNLEKTDSIQVGYGPENMLLFNNKAYVANSGGWSWDSTISVVDVVNDEITDTFQTADCPVDLVQDLDDNIWVLCKGYTDYATIETEAYIQQISIETGEILWQSQVGTASDYSSTPARCTASPDGSIVYFTKPDGIYQVNVGNPLIQEQPLIGGNFYGLEVNPKDGNIFVFEASFSGNGTMKIYSPAGALLSQGTVGIGPNGAVFHE